MSTLLRDVFDIPEHAGSEDYVLRLTDSVGATGTQHAVDDYVVTPDLAEAFDAALHLVSDAIDQGVSRGAFLAGSFGSGKSHFMAVLHALLRQVPAARAKPELSSVIAAHDPSLADRKVLPLAFHFLDAKSMEEELFESYLRQVSALHPDATLPALFRSDSLLANAESLRSQIGDTPFFEGLGGQGGDDEWAGLLGSNKWDEQRYEQARAAAPQSSQRQQLVTALVDSYFSAFTRHADYVDLDTGLSAIAAHAKELGYDAVVLFLDELVLWLAFAVQDTAFFRAESQKLTKLVESSIGARAIPLVSFVARQMDLRRYLADAGASGNEQELLDRAFRHQEGRFATITLGDDNLPYVANRRLLRPRDAEAGRAIADAFSRLDREPAVWDVLLDGANADDRHRGASEDAFRMTYPFSPALVSTLRSLASVMQRDRTALKVMQQMLVDRRDTLTIDDVIPVGDSYDYIVHGQVGAALDPKVAALFRSAMQLYAEKLRPVLLATHHLVVADLADPARLTPAFRADDRLAKTLLLSAVAPNVPALKALTAGRLASLNHGSIVSPLPGNEASIVLSKVRTWSQQVPEIHVESDPRNPVIAVQLSDVDYESVVDKAKGEDNPGRQRELIRTLVTDALGVDLGNPDMTGTHRHTILWRGSRREVELVFGNVRDAGWLTEDHFRAGAGAWRIVIDHPFDEAGHSCAEDISRIDGLRARNVNSQTIVWLPRFLSADRMRDLRRLVVLSWLLGGTGERWTSHADHLSEVDRVQAKTILEAQRNSLREGLTRVIQQAYGAAAPTPGSLLEDAAHEQVLWSLDGGFQPAPPVGATLRDAFRHLIGQAFDATYPAHPDFQPGDVEVRPIDLKHTLAHLERAVADPEHRVLLQGDTHAVRRVANALSVGYAAETHFLFGDDRFSPWGSEIEKALARSGHSASDPVTVAELRDAIDAIRPAQGLRPEVADLVILGWGLLRQRAWYYHGGPLPTTPQPGQLQPAMELRPQPLPDLADWPLAVQRAAALLGVPGGSFMTPVAVAALAEDARTRAAACVNDARALVGALEQACTRLGIDGGDRLSTAERTARLVEDLQHQRGVALITNLARVDLGTTDAIAARSLASARDVTRALAKVKWDRLARLRAAAVETPADATALSILGDLTAAAQAEEFVTGLALQLDRTDNRIFTWLDERTAPKAPVPAPPGSVPLGSVPLGSVPSGSEPLGSGPSGSGPLGSWPPVPAGTPVTLADDIPLVVTPGAPTPQHQWTARTTTAASAQSTESVLAELQRFLTEHRGAGVEVQWRLAP